MGVNLLVKGMVIIMDNFIITLLSCSATMSVLSLIYMALIPKLSKKYTAKGLYSIWLLVVVGWIFPFRPNLGICLIPFQVSETQAICTDYIVVNKQMNMIAEEIGSNSALSIWQLLLYVWVLGMAAVLLYHGLKYRSFLKTVRRWSKEIKDQEILHILHTLKEEAGIRKQVGIKTCLNIASPMMIGFFRPTILLPSMNVATDDLLFILKHELIHLKRKDLWYKALILLATSVHW
jgi:beta-lactamase regulating signal transducer with metallopeptidase domain